MTILDAASFFCASVCSTLTIFRMTSSAFVTKILSKSKILAVFMGQQGKITIKVNYRYSTLPAAKILRHCFSLQQVRISKGRGEAIQLLF
jgi:hypothetical protein